MVFVGLDASTDARAYSTLCTRLTPNLQIELYFNHSNHFETSRLFEQLKISSEVKVFRVTMIKQIEIFIIVIAYQM